MKKLISTLAVCLMLPQGMSSVMARDVYVYPTGSKYHYSETCISKKISKYGKKVPLEEAIKWERTPCKKCVE